MARCIVFCSMPTGAAPDVREDDFVIACDRGVSYACEAGVAPDLALGDFDSYDGALPDVPVKRFPVEKDDTDSMLAVREGLSRGYRDFVLYGALGGRLDHTLANLQLLLFLVRHGASGVLRGERDTVTTVCNETRTFPRREGVSLSVLAFGGEARGVTLTGVQYELHDGVMTDAFPLGHGNHITADEAAVTVTDGVLFVVESEIS